MSDPKNDMDKQINQNDDRGVVIATNVQFKGQPVFEKQSINMFLPNDANQVVEAPITFRADDGNGPPFSCTTTVDEWNIAVGDQEQFHLEN